MSKRPDYCTSLSCDDLGGTYCNQCSHAHYKGSTLNPIPSNITHKRKYRWVYNPRLGFIDTDIPEHEQIDWNNEALAKYIHKWLDKIDPSRKKPKRTRIIEPMPTITELEQELLKLKALKEQVQKLEELKLCLKVREAGKGDASLSLYGVTTVNQKPGENLNIKYPIYEDLAEHILIYVDHKIFDYKVTIDQIENQQYTVKLPHIKSYGMSIDS